MSQFPAFYPASRDRTPGTYPHSQFITANGRDSRVRLSNAVVGAQVRLTFPLLSETQMESIRSHHAGVKGSFQAFTLPDQIWSGSDTPAWFTPSGYQWIYAGKPEIEEINADGAVNACLYNVSIELEAVPISRTILLGATFKVAVDWIPGSITGFLSGATWDVTVSWLPGSVTSWQPGTIGDPYYANVSLLLNGDAFTDRSANALTVTPQGNAAIVAGQGPFGGAAMSFDGQFATLVSVPANGLVLDADFTIEIWVKFASPSSYQYFMASSNDSGYFQMALNGMANNAIGIGRGSIDWPLVFSGHNLQSNAWQFVTVRRSNGVAQCFVGSTQIGPNVNDTTSYIVGPTALYIGHQDSNGTMIGLIGPLRITNGIARTITVPTGPFPTFAS